MFSRGLALESLISLDGGEPHNGRSIPCVPSTMPWSLPRSRSAFLKNPFTQKVQGNWVCLGFFEKMQNYEKCEKSSFPPWSQPHRFWSIVPLGKLFYGLGLLQGSLFCLQLVHLSMTKRFLGAFKSVSPHYLKTVWALRLWGAQTLSPPNFPPRKVIPITLFFFWKKGCFAE